MTSTAGVQRETLPKQGESKKNSKKLKTEETEQLQAKIDTLQKEVDTLQILREKLTEQEDKTARLREDLGFLGEEREWLWRELKKLALHGRLVNNVLMVIEPEHSTSTWAAWGPEGEVMTPNITTLLLTSTPFSVAGYTHCSS